jgi:hypothetical protein
MSRLASPPSSQYLSPVANSKFSWRAQCSDVCSPTPCVVYLAVRSVVVPALSKRKTAI